MARLWFKSFENLTVHKTSLVQGSLFLLAVYTHEVPLCLCSVFCSRSQVRLSTTRCRAFGARITRRTVSCNLKWLCGTLLTLKQACTSCRAPPQCLKWPCRTLRTLTKASTSFTAPPLHSSPALSDLRVA